MTKTGIDAAGFPESFCEYLIPPLRLPSRQIAHASQQEILRALSLSISRSLFGNNSGLLKVINHMVTLYIISGITVGTAYGTADDQMSCL